MHRVSQDATTGEAAQTHAVVEYLLADGGAGTLIDPDGATSAVHTLHWRYGHRLDWPALLATFGAREHDADRKAADLIRRLMTESNNHERKT